jgi:vacuolar-type H+-ATPase subunit H
MDREQEKFYEDEQKSTEQATSDIEENFKSADSADDMSFFIKLLRALRETLEMGRKIPFSNKWSVDAEQCLAILRDMENTLPEAIQYGWQMYSERDRIMGYAERKAMERVTSAEMSANSTLEEAKKNAERIVADAEDEANAIVNDAQNRADKLVAEDEIVQRAREEARIIKNEAKVEAGEMKLKATHEALQTLTGVEDELAEALNAIRRNRKQLDEEAQ